MQLKTWYLKSSSRSPYETLALEEALLEHLSGQSAVLYLYRHAPSVILGRNQNAWSECRHEAAREADVRVARRISGGGAVYHDEGNLNFSFLVPSGSYDLQRQLSVLTGALREFGVEASFSGRNDILADGRKFSGSAFCHRGGNAFHHGTLLVDTDLSQMERFLAVSEDKFRAKGVTSVRARVVNLRELAPDLTVPDLMEAVVHSFGAEYGGSPEEMTVPPETQEHAFRLSQRNASWQWVFGKTPDFDVTASARFPWGGLTFCFSLANGSVKEADVFSDAMDESFVRLFGPALRGTVFRSEQMARRLESLSVSDSLQRRIQCDAAQYLRSRNY